MSSRITLLATAVTALLAAAAGNAQNVATNAIAAGAEPESTACTHLFGSGNLKWCVNEHGNLMQFESPAGQEHIRIGGFQEGYVLCVNGDAATYYDNGLGETGWFPPVLVAKTTTSVTIDRTTNDGKFKLTQKWTRDSTERDLTVQMTLLNLGPAVNVKLARNSDIDANNDPPDDRYDASRYGAWVRDVDGVAMYGLTLSPAPTSVIEGVSLSSAKCNPIPAAVPGGPGDPGVYVIYNFGEMKTNAKKIVKVGYRAQ
jgi:hypothetical protein